MFVILMKFSAHKHRAKEFMADHNRWLDRHIDEGAILLAGGLGPGLGGILLAHGLTKEDLAEKLQQDPFVAHDVVQPEILAVSPSKACADLRFLLGGESVL